MPRHRLPSISSCKSPGKGLVYFFEVSIVEVTYSSTPRRDGSSRESKVEDFKDNILNPMLGERCSFNSFSDWETCCAPGISSRLVSLSSNNCQLDSHERANGKFWRLSSSLVSYTWSWSRHRHNYVISLSLKESGTYINPALSKMCANLLRFISSISSGTERMQIREDDIWASFRSSEVLGLICSGAQRG